LVGSGHAAASCAVDGKVDEYVEPGERVVELGCGKGEPVGRVLSERYDWGFV